MMTVEVGVRPRDTCGGRAAPRDAHDMALPLRPRTPAFRGPVRCCGFLCVRVWGICQKSGWSPSQGQEIPRLPRVPGDGDVAGSCVQLHGLTSPGAPDSLDLGSCSEDVESPARG